MFLASSSYKGIFSKFSFSRLLVKQSTLSLLTNLLLSLLIIISSFNIKRETGIADIDELPTRKIYSPLLKK